MKKHRSLIISAIGLAAALVAKTLLSSLLGVEYVASHKTIELSGLGIKTILSPGWSIAAIITIAWLIGYFSSRLAQSQYFRTKLSD